MVNLLDVIKLLLQSAISKNNYPHPRFCSFCMADEGSGIEHKNNCVIGIILRAIDDWVESDKS